jgi:hypothetical protein
MATRYIVRAVTNGTGVNLAVSGRSPQVALDKARASRLGRKASAFLVFERASGTVVASGINFPGRHNNI